MGLDLFALQKEYRSLLEDMVSFRSISAERACRSELERAASYLKSYLSQAGFSVRIIPTQGNGIVIATYEYDPQAPTAVVYGHYDVQPADMADGWSYDPFSLNEREGRLYGRGVSDNKGQHLIHAVVVKNLIAEDLLRYNVVFVIEGDEETGSGYMEGVLADRSIIPRADFVMVSDGETFLEEPVLNSSTRGTFNVRIDIKTSSSDLHSGLFGGVVPSAATEAVRLGNLVASTDFQKELFGASFLSPVDPLADAELSLITGTSVVFAGSKEDFTKRSGIRSCLEITGIESGYTGEGFRNSIPSKAFINCNIRLAPELSAVACADDFGSKIRAMAPDYCEVSLNFEEGVDGAYLADESQYVQHAMAVWKEVLGVSAVMQPCGGSLPIGGFFKKHLDVPQIYAGFANPDCGMHAADENIRLDYVDAGLSFSEVFFSTVPGTGQDHKV